MIKDEQKTNALLTLPSMRMFLAEFFASPQGQILPIVNENTHAPSSFYPSQMAWKHVALFQISSVTSGALETNLPYWTPSYRAKLLLASALAMT